MNADFYPVSRFIQDWWPELFSGAVILAVFPLAVAYVVFVERKILADKQAVPGPWTAESRGVLEPFRDGLKLLLKRDVVPENADKFIFWLAPILSLVAALTSLGAIAFGPAVQVARDINVGILFVIAMGSLGFLGVLLGGWASSGQNSNIRAMRGTAQLVSYGVAGGLAILSALLLSGTLNIRTIVEAQRGSGAWFIFLAPIGFLIYLIAAIAQSNRVPFDLPEQRPEPVSGDTVEHGGFGWSLYFLAEYANRIVVASIATTLFLGGWLRPFSNEPWFYWLDYLPPILIVLLGVYCIYRAGMQSTLARSLWMWALALVCLCVAVVFAVPVAVVSLQFLLPGLHGAFWFLLKVGFFLYIFAWLRLSVPRYSFDQLMRVGWHILIPVAIANVFAIGIALFLEYEAGWNRWFAFGVMNFFPVVLAAYLMRLHEKRAAGTSRTRVMATDSYAG
jgi:NADH-quinone oxidoreductase subunit H